jgi:Mrp family chromosome partitioning ATPase
MTKRGKFGDRPGIPDDELDVKTRAGAPLPLVTAPMAAVSRPPTSEGGSRALAHTVALPPDSERGLAIEPRPTVTMQPMSPSAMGAMGAMGAMVPGRSDPPPEIGLTQHHLPDDAAPDARLILHLDPDSERAAQFRVLRHHLLESGRPQVVVVTSPKGGEGKTTTAVNLALALAECGRAKVLLAETHLRRPQLAGVFRFVPPWCFAEQLAAHRHQPLLPWGLVDIPQLWLHVGAVNPRSEQAQLLDAPAFAIAMERLRLGGYDHIVIDAPPVFGSAEVNLLQDAADGVVLVARGGMTTARDLRRAIDQITSAKVLGTVLLDG